MIQKTEMFPPFVAVFLVSEIAACLYWLFSAKMPRAKVENPGSIRKWAAITKGDWVIKDFI